MKKLLTVTVLCISLSACADTSQISEQTPADNGAIQSQMDRIEMQNNLLTIGSAIILGFLLPMSGI